MQIKTVALIALICTGASAFFSFVQFVYVLKDLNRFSGEISSVLMIVRWLASLAAEASLALFFAVLYSKQK